MYLRRTKHDEIHALTKECISSHLASRCSDPSASVTVTKCSLVQYSNSLRIWPIFSLPIRSKMRQSFLSCSVIRDLSPDELHVAGGLNVLLDHLNEERRLRPVLKVGPAPVRNLAQLLDEVDEIFQHASHGVAHIAEQEPPDDPVRVPVVDLPVTG